MVLIKQLLNSANSNVTLDEIRLIIDKMQLKPTYPIILIGGTNGKGSVCAYLTTILTLAGYKVGSFTSPHVFKYNERISIAKQSISDDQLTMVLNQVMAASNATLNKTLGLFSTFALAAHKFFIESEIDIAIVEVGIGGRLDTTNLFTPTISAITNINYDHCHLLGHTLDAIGLEKAAIYRPCSGNLFGDSQVPLSVLQYAQSIGVKLDVYGQDFGYVSNALSFDVWCDERKFYTLPYPAIRGVSQMQNAALALAILNKLRDNFVVNLATIKSGLLQTKLIGRFQVMPGLPQVVLDVAHNPQAVSNMLKNMLKLPFAKNEYAVFAVANDKDAQQIIQLCCDKFSKWFIASLNSDRALDVDIIKQELVLNGVAENNVILATSITEAYQKAYSLASNDVRITCFGSFLVVEEVFVAINKKRC